MMQRTVQLFLFLIAFILSACTAQMIDIPIASPVATVQETTVPIGDAADVINVVDGDTIDVLVDGAEYRVRYILINTPERRQTYYKEATDANSALVTGKTVYLVRDVSETDRYGRLLRYVYLEDGTFINAELVRLGYAQIATYPPDVSMIETIRAAQNEAILNKRGLWAE